MPARRLLHFFANLFRRRRLDDRVEGEMDSYVQMLVDERVAAGMAPDEARRLALAEAGSATAVKEHVRDARAGAWLEQTWRDLWLAARLLRRNPGFAVVAILTLALGIGANTAIFQLIDAVRLRTLPVERPHELVSVQLRDMDGARGYFQTSPAVPPITYPIWSRLQQYHEPFAGLFAWGTDIYNLAAGGEARPVRGLLLSGDAFRTLGVDAVAGRLFTAADDRPDCGPVGVVLAYGFWQREYGADPAVVGRPLTLSGQSLPILGVTPPSFYGLEVGRNFDVAIPLCAESSVVRTSQRLRSGTWWWLHVIGRLRPDRTIDEATRYVASISPALFRETLPANYPSVSVDKYLAFSLTTKPVGTGVSSVRSAYAGPLGLLLGLAGLVLLIACGNLANLMLAAASAREREMAIRLAIGASRGRLIRQSLMQSLLLAMIGAALAIVVARGLSRFLVASLTTTGEPLFLDLHTDLRLFGFAAALSALTCLVFGIAPALRATRASPGDALRSDGRGVAGSRGHTGLRRALVVAQLAFSLVLLVAALLFSSTLGNLRHANVGFTTDGLVVTNVAFRGLNLPPDHWRAFKDDFVDRVRAIPGVAGAAEVGAVPLSGSGRSSDVWIEHPGEPQRHGVTINTAGEDYFRTVGTRLAGGREFDRRDRAGAPLVAIVNETFLRQAHPALNGASPLGRRLHIEARPNHPETVYDIVGVARDAKFWDLREEFPPMVFLPVAQDPSPGPAVRLLVRAAGPAAGLIPALTAVATSVNPQLSLSFDVLDAQIQNSLVRERLMAVLSGFFGALAALLAMIGLYGVVSYMVARRRSEIGLRMALGASRADVIGLVLRESCWLLAAGLAIGAGLAVAAARMAGTLLFGISPFDVAPYVTAAAALAFVTLAASYLPAARAARLDPTAALRQ